MSPDDPRHGEERGYFAHRKAGEPACEDCKTAHRAATKRRELDAMNGKARWIPALGSTRRIQALVALGWSLTDVSIACGWKASHEPARSVLRRQNVSRGTAAKIDEAYRRLCMTPGPNSLAASLARRRGWLPPLAWDDIDDPNEKPTPAQLCRRDGCAGQTVAKGLCRRHYYQVTPRKAAG